MNTGLRNLLSASRLQAALVSTLLLVPLASQSQTFFGSGGTSNTASDNPNLAFGLQALFSNTTGIFNTAIGYQSLYSNTTGYDNAALGYGALALNTTGGNNTASGALALYYNTTGEENVASGYEALFNNTTGYWNTANGAYSLYSNSTGSNNTANGYNALGVNTTGDDNTANGVVALYHNTTGSFNAANGYQALSYNTTGNYNAAHGDNALFSNTKGSNNTADGYAALFDNVTGNFNIALGYAAGQKLTTGSNNIEIGNSGVAKEAGVIRIGTKGTHKAVFIAGIDGVTSGKGVAVYINASGQLGTLTSSRRFKNDIKDMGSVSDKLMKLRPVTFRYKDSAESGPHSLQYGLIAEEVAKVYPDLVQYDKAGKPFTIYYHLLTPMLLNELQKVHRENMIQKTSMKAEIASLKSELTALKQSQQQQLASLAKLTALVQTSQNRSPLQSAAYVQH